MIAGLETTLNEQELEKRAHSQEQCKRSGKVGPFASESAK
jgi:hypothetical protein